VLGHWLGDLAVHLGAPARATWAPPALGDALLLAGLYQLTPLKLACLDHCRLPVVYVTRHWREDYDGALWLGMKHGVYCLGCWAFCLVLVAAGTMSLAWMLLLTLVVFAEKCCPAAGTSPSSRVACSSSWVWAWLLIGCASNALLLP
jgi:predicted metal-binding membrane protein